MHLQRNFYEVLGLSAKATTVEIKQRYRELARKFHPDLVQDKALGQRIFTQINQAYRTLGDAERRAAYDATLNAPPPRAFVDTRQQTVIPGTGSVGAQNGAASRPSSEIEKMVRDADMAMIQGQAANAKALCDSVLKSDPNNALALSILGDALVHLKKNDEAIKAYKKSLSIATSSIVEAKLTRMQAVRDANAQANGTHNGNGVRTAPKPERGLFDRLLNRK